MPGLGILDHMSPNASMECIHPIALPCFHWSLYKAGTEALSSVTTFGEVVNQQRALREVAIYYSQ